MALAMLVAPAAGHELGDFGRVKPGVLNDELIPWADKLDRRLRGQPVSDLNLTDEEREMRDRLYRFLIARHVKDWAFDYEQIVAVASFASRRAGREDLYYRWLTRERYASSRVRYNTISDDIGADVLTLPGAFASVCAVTIIDRQRAVAVAELDDIEAEMIAEVLARKAENALHVDRFVRALRYRYESYSYALDHFLVETPYPEAVNVDSRLSGYAVWLGRAEAGDFCIEDGAASWNEAEPLPGRVLRNGPGEGPYRK